MKIITKDFISGGTIPAEFTCDGEGRMFDLKVTELPQDAQCLAMIIEDPDAPNGTFTHFLAWNIPIMEAVADCSDIMTSSLVGTNSAGQSGYAAPCPPSGSHRYYIKFYALKDLLDLEAGSDRSMLDKAMNGKIIKEAQIMGVYSRGK